MTEPVPPFAGGAGTHEAYAYAAAKHGSEALRDRLLAYFAKHHPDSPLGRLGRGIDRPAGGIGFAGRGEMA
ncbi:MAG: hypothetical protein QOH86_1534 [Sphingomonadales bacterium]|jgi:hypothetical protein|nr:hypothetical protein [Sphingomonadales bacterium]